MKLFCQLLKLLLKFVFTAQAGLIIAGSMAPARPAAAGELRGVWRNNAGVRRFGGGSATDDGRGEGRGSGGGGGQNAAQAFDDFTGALGDLPFSGEVHLNVGNSFLLRREYEKAISEFEQAVKNSPGTSAHESETKFRAHFNMAVALTELKKTDEALAAYQRALEIRPDSVETKTNMELLTSSSGGGGEGDPDKDDKDGSGQKKDQKKDPNKKDEQKKDDKGEKKKEEPQKAENPRSTPRPFKSEELSPQDVKRILEELKRQEEQIRAKMQNEQRKDAPPEKDW